LPRRLVGKIGHPEPIRPGARNWRLT
jgi:hypothetical protein